MKKTIIIAVLAFGMNVTAQTTPVVKDVRNWVTNVRGVYDATSSIEFKPAGQLDLKSTNGVNINSAVIDSRGWISTRGATFTEKVSAANGTVNATSKEVINGSQLHTTNTNVTAVNDRLSGQVARIDQQVVRLDGQVQRIDGLVAKTDATNRTVENNRITAANATAQVQTNLNTQVSRLDGRINDTNANVAVNTNAIADLQSTKADKAQVANDIAKAKSESLAYTDNKVKVVNDKLDLEIESNRLAQKRLDDKINSNDEKINQRVRDLEIKIDNRFNAVMSYVGNEFAAVNNRIEGLGASMVALSAAATSSVYNSNKPTNLNIATGLYGRATAIAVGMSHFFNSSTKVSVNWSQGSNTKNAVGIGAGFCF